MAQLISQAESQLRAGDYGAAVKTCDAGMRLDAGNSDLQAVLDRAKPKFEAAERARRSGLSRTELLKEKGDDFYKQASFEVGRGLGVLCASTAGKQFPPLSCWVVKLLVIHARKIKRGIEQDAFENEHPDRTAMEME